MAEITITNENFEKEVLQSDIPVLLDFWATWCGPCQMLSPIVANIAEEFDGTIKVGKVNVDTEPVLANAFHIASIPTLIVMKNGKAEAKTIGYCTKEEIIQLLKL